MTYNQLLKQTIDKYNEEKDPIKRKMFAAFGRSLKSKIEMNKKSDSEIKKALL